jgi:hypothetical protein
MARLNHARLKTMKLAGAQSMLTVATAVFAAYAVGGIPLQVSMSLSAWQMPRSVHLSHMYT